MVSVLAMITGNNISIEQATITKDLPRTGRCPPLATRWKPGQSGNPNGRPIGAKKQDQLLEQYAPVRIKDSLDYVGRKKREPFYDYIANKAYESERVALKVLDKLIPNAGEDHRDTVPQNVVVVIRADQVDSVQISPPSPQIERSA